MYFLVINKCQLQILHGAVSDEEIMLSGNVEVLKEAILACTIDPCIRLDKPSRTKNVLRHDRR